VDEELLLLLQLKVAQKQLGEAPWPPGLQPLRPYWSLLPGMSCLPSRKAGYATRHCHWSRLRPVARSHRRHHRLLCVHHGLQGQKRRTQGFHCNPYKTSARTCQASQTGFLERVRSKTVSANPEPVVFPSSSTRTAPPTSSYDNISSCIVSSIDPLGNHFYVNVIIKGINRSIRSPAIIDSRATALFVSKCFVQHHHIICSPLPNTIALHNIDSSKNKAGLLTHFVHLTLTIGSWNEPTNFLVTDLSPEDIILGLLWLKKVNPTIDWDSSEMEIPNSPEQFTPSPPYLLRANRSERRA
jgi:hypothetical protein